MITRTPPVGDTFRRRAPRSSGRRRGWRWRVVTGGLTLLCWALHGLAAPAQPTLADPPPVRRLPDPTQIPAQPSTTVAQNGQPRPGDQGAQPNVPRVPAIPQGGEQPPAPGAAPGVGDMLPQPRPLDAFNPSRIRLPRLGLDDRDVRPPFCPPAETPYPTLSPEEKKIYDQFIGDVVDPQSTIDLIVGRMRIIRLKEPPTRTQAGDSRIAEFDLLGPREIGFIGRSPGTTVINLWFPDPRDRTQEVILSYLVRVVPDPEAKARLEQVYRALADEINMAFPDSVINLFLVGDKLVLTGQAKDIAEAAKILQVVQSNAPAEETSRIPVDQVSLNLDGSDLPDLRNFTLGGGGNIINLLRVPGEQQVALKVIVAEVNRTAARSIGVNFSITNNQGLTVFSQNTGSSAGGGGGAQFGGGGGAAFSSNLPILLDNGQISLAVNALRNLSYARSLAEPVLTTMNGQTATFQAGGAFPVPVTTGFTAAGLQGVSFVPFGVQLTFTPFITDKDRIRLDVQAEVSTRDVATGTSVGGSAVPGLNTRNFQTTVELREGQTLAVAGLLNNNLGAETVRVPLLGDLPVLNNFFGFQKISHGEQELVILITPQLVHPLEPNELPALPGVDIVEPGDLEFYLLGRIEGYRAVDYRSQVRTDIHKMLRYRKCEDIFLFGPKGHAQ